MIPDHCLCGCTERLDEFGQLDPCPDYLDYLDSLDEVVMLSPSEDVYWEGLRAA